MKYSYQKVNKKGHKITRCYGGRDTATKSLSRRDHDDQENEVQEPQLPGEAAGGTTATRRFRRRNYIYQEDQEKELQLQRVPGVAGEGTTTIRWKKSSKRKHQEDLRSPQK